MKTNVIKSLVLTVGLVTPLFLLPAASNASRGDSRVSISYSSGHGHSGSHRGHGGSYRYGHDRHYSHSGYHRYPSYHYSHSRSYHSRPSFGIGISSGYYGSRYSGYYGSRYSGYYSSLPFGYSSCVVGGLTYYQHGGRYYRPYRTGYTVVADPYIVERRPVTVVTSRTVAPRSIADKYESYPRIWVSGEEYLIDEGDIFRITSSGLVWAELPLGSVASSLPTHASSVWYKDVEYFEAGGVYFQRIPEGYRLILPPWDGEF